MTHSSELWQQPNDIPEHFNACDFFIDRHLREERADKTAVIDAAGSITYGQLAYRVAQTATALTELGLHQEDRIAMVMLDSAEFHSVFWGAIRHGIIPIALNTLLVTENYEYILNDCRARVLCVSAALLPVIEPILNKLPHLQHVLIDGKSSPDSAHADLAATIEGASPSIGCTDTQRDEVAFWLYSSGSTGNPKGVLHRHSSLYATGLHYGRQVIDIQESDIVYSAAKLFFAYGLGNAMTFPLFVGATSVLLASRPTPDAAMAQISKFNATLFFGVPTLYAAILSNTQLINTTQHNLRLCISAGEALPADIARRWTEQLGCEVLDGVGSTEMLHIYLSNRVGQVQPGSSGLAVPGYQLSLRDEAGSEVAAGEIGELVVRGDSAANSYWNLRTKTVATFAGYDTWTGDKYQRDHNGYYIYCGRTDDMFKSGGNWVSPFEVESTLIEHPSVMEAAVIAKCDAAGNEKPFAYVVLQPGEKGTEQLATQLKQLVKEKIELWKHPRWIEFTDTLPKTATGKIQRFKLRSTD